MFSHSHKNLRDGLSRQIRKICGRECQFFELIIWIPRGGRLPGGFLHHLRINHRLERGNKLHAFLMFAKPLILFGLTGCSIQAFLRAWYQREHVTGYQRPLNRCENSGSL